MFCDSVPRISIVDEPEEFSDRQITGSDLGLGFLFVVVEFLWPVIRTVNGWIVFMQA